MIRFRLFLSAIVFFAMSRAMAAETEVAPAGVQAPAIVSTIKPLETLPITGLGRHLRALQLVQDRIVSGNIKAVDAQRALLEQMIATLETRAGLAGLSQHDAEVFLPMALLNGADPERVRAILGQSGVQTQNAFLLGALAYAEGRVPEALAAFDKVDEVELQPLSRAQFDLTKGVMLVSTEPEKAVKNFAKARLGAPGTLIEEAALRREALLEMARPDVFLPLVRSYLHRFSASPFASAFISQFAFSISDLDEKTQDSITSQLDGLLAQAQRQDRQNFYAILARSSLIGGNHALANYATERAVSELSDPSQLLSARLYRAAFNIAGQNHVAAAAELESLMRVPLQAADREILSAAISVAQELRRWPYGKSESIMKNTSLETANSLLPQGDNAATANMTLAQKLLDDTEQLSGATP